MTETCWSGCVPWGAGGRYNPLSRKTVTFAWFSRSARGSVFVQKTDVFEIFYVNVFVFSSWRFHFSPFVSVFSPLRFMWGFLSFSISHFLSLSFPLSLSLHILSGFASVLISFIMYVSFLFSFLYLCLLSLTASMHACFSFTFMHTCAHRYTRTHALSTFIPCCLSCDGTTT